MNSVVCWLWNDGGSRTYLPEHVNVLQRMVARHLAEPHRFVCVADETKGFSPAVEVFPTPPEAVRVGRLRTPEGARFPSCYRRLWTFSKEAAALGDRILLLDIDLVVVNDLAPIFKRTEDFVGWRPFRDWGNQLRFGGGIYLLTAGMRRHVWEGFKGETSIREARAKGYRGSDQAWISYSLGSVEKYFARDSGIYSIRDMAGTEHAPPKDARLVQFNGPVKPWHTKLAWARAAWR